MATINKTNHKKHSQSSYNSSGGIGYLLTKFNSIAKEVYALVNLLRNC